MHGALAKNLYPAQGPATTVTTIISLARIQAALTRPLPGYRGQTRMMPDYRRDPDLYARASADCRRAAVLLLLYPHHGELHMLLTVRPRHLPDHPGQVAFPGGARDGDETVAQTALREGQEEVGIDPDRVQVLGRLTRLYIPPSHFCVQTVVGYTPHRPAWRPNPHEVAELVEVPISHFFDAATWREERREVEGALRRIPYFAVGAHKVWGATAIILAEFVTAVEETPA